MDIQLQVFNYKKFKSDTCIGHPRDRATNRVRREPITIDSFVIDTIKRKIGSQWNYRYEEVASLRIADLYFDTDNKQRFSENTSSIAFRSHCFFGMGVICQLMITGIILILSGNKFVEGKRRLLDF